MSTHLRTERQDPAPREPRTEPPPPQPAEAILALQRGAGNRAVGNVLARGRTKGAKKKTKQQPPTTTTEPKAKKKEDKKWDTFIKQAGQHSARASKASSDAAGSEKDAAAAVDAVEHLLLDPLVGPNADVKSSIESALATAKTEQAEVTRQADVVRARASGSAASADAVKDTEPDHDGFGDPYFHHGTATKKAGTLADEAVAAAGRANTALRRAENALKSAQRARDTVQHAKTWVEGGSGDAESKAASAVALAKKWDVGYSKLAGLRGKATRKVVDEQWRARRTDLIALEAEAEKILGWANLIRDAKDRAEPGKMTHLELQQVQPLLTAAVIELRKDGDRDEVVAAARLKLLGDKLDEIDTNTANNSADAARIAQLKLEGRYSQNKTEIPEITQTSLTGPEGTNVDELFTAYDNGETTNPGGGKWGEYHGNNAGDLPGIRGMGGYEEYYVRKIASDTSGVWGSRRLVRHVESGRWYFSRTHYGSNGTPPFVLIKKGQ